jgi:hypothetical protein
MFSSTVFKQSGTSSATTNEFTISPNALEWDVSWAYDCTGLAAGDFSFFVYNTSEEPDLSDQGPLDLNIKGQGDESYSDTGTFYLQIPTACAWSVVVSDSGFNPVPGVATPSAKLSTSSEVVAQAGGALTLTAAVHGGKWCTFVSSPTVPGIDGKVRCSRGTVSRQGQVPPSVDAQTVQFEVVVVNATSLKAAGSSILERSPTTLLSQSGSGSTTTAQFVIPPTDSQWTLSWTYDCTAQLFGMGLFDMFVTGSIGDQPVIVDTGENAPPGSGSNVYQDTGSFSLMISSTCNWTVSVVG